MKKIKIALAGNPNAGKTTLFNLVAGTNYHVGNYPGVTVEKKKAIIKYKEQEIELVDLPGTYSLNAYSLEEIIARDYIVNEKPDLVVQVVDASNLERNLYLTTQLLELETNLIISLNMFDVASKRGIEIDVQKLSEKLEVPIVKTIARSGMGKIELLDEVINYKLNPMKSKIKINYGSDLTSFISDIEQTLSGVNFLNNKYPLRWLALKYLENDKKVLEEGTNFAFHEDILKKIKKLETHLKSTLDTYPEVIIADYKYGYLNSLLKDVVKTKIDPLDRIYTSDKIDSVLTHRLVGPLLMLLVIYCIYQFTFWASQYPTNILQLFFQSISAFIDKILNDGIIKSLIISGIIEGVGGVLAFIPLIFLMFSTIAILEDSGYMARVAYMLDRVFKFFGLQGSSAISFIVSGGIAGGCAVPGIMATRIIRGRKERLLTMLTAPFMMCGAKLPVFALLLGAFYSGDKGAAMLVITLFTWLSALIIAKIIGKFLIRGESSAFIMELPPYRVPTLKGIFLHSWERTWIYIKKAGTVILGISIILWALMNFPGLPSEEVEKFEIQKSKILLNLRYEQNSNSENIKIENKLAEIEENKNMEELKHSIAGQIGVFIEPVTKYAGFDWRTNIALIGGFAAKEVVVSTLGTAYSLGDKDRKDRSSLSEKLASNPDWSRSNAIALIIFTILYTPCLVAIISIIRESGHIKWGLFAMSAYTLIAYVAAVIAYQFI